MSAYIALLRAVNVGGFTLPMEELRAAAAGAGLANPRTYIASGNLLFDADLSEPQAQSALQDALHARTGKPIAVLVRTGAQMAAVAAANPFADQPGARVVAIFLDAAPPADWQAAVTGQTQEIIKPGLREFYVHYPTGQGTSKLKIRAAKDGTARNMNTVAKLAALAAGGR